MEQSARRPIGRLVLHLFHLFRLHHADGGLHQVADHRLHVPAHVAHFGEFGRFHLDKGGPTSFASLRAISVLPTPVGPIIKMFLGTTSSRSSSGSKLRRYRLRRAMATARLAAFWPMMYLSSSATIWRGVRSALVGVIDPPFTLYLLNDDLMIGKHANLRRRSSAPLRAISLALISGACAFKARAGGQRVSPSGTDRQHAVIRLDHFTGPGTNSRLLCIHDDHHRFQPAQHPVRSPFLGQLHGRPLSNCRDTPPASLRTSRTASWRRPPTRQIRRPLCRGTTCAPFSPGVS